MSCWKTAIRTRNQERRMWTAISILLLILTINRLLDLQSAPLEIVRALAVEEGWYKQHEVLQVGFIIFIAIVCVTAVVNLLMWVRSPPRSTRVALLDHPAVWFCAYSCNFPALHRPHSLEGNF